ncbi:MAG: SAM-dependent methyltransferase [Candidatus Hodarchaeota archaeon]
METPRRVVSKIDEVIKFPSFRDYMDKCLYDLEFGYYSTGKVRFGEDEHFWTYPQWISPLFGFMIAEASRKVFEAILSNIDIPEEEVLTILELGGGDGHLAKDTLDYIFRQESTPEWKHIVPRIRYIIGDISPTLRNRQIEKLRNYIKHKIVEIRDINALEIGKWDGSFYGMVIANEITTAFPCERIRLVNVSQANRVHVAPIYCKNLDTNNVIAPKDEKYSKVFSGDLDDSEHILDEISFWALIAGWKGNKNPPLRIAEVEVPLSLGWINDNKDIDKVPEELTSYLKQIKDLVDDLASCNLLPVDLHWSSMIHEFIKQVKTLISGKKRCGAIFIVDYGGTSRHILDPRSIGPHMRVYGLEKERAHHNTPYIKPSWYDITWDADFTYLGRLAKTNGLNVVFYGHQSALEKLQGDLCSMESIDYLINRLVEEGIKDKFRLKASFEAYRRVRSFRGAPGFRLMVICSPNLALSFNYLGESEPYDKEGLWTICKDFNPSRLENAIKQSNIPKEALYCLKPCGDPIADLSDNHLYEYRKDILRLLKKFGNLVPPGSKWL